MTHALHDYNFRFVNGEYLSFRGKMLGVGTPTPLGIIAFRAETGAFFSVNVNHVTWARSEKVEA